MTQLTTPYYNFAAFSTRAAGGANGWSNPANVQSNDGTFASHLLANNEISDFLDCLDWSGKAYVSPDTALSGFTVYTESEFTGSGGGVWVVPYSKYYRLNGTDILAVGAANPPEGGWDVNTTDVIEFGGPDSGAAPFTASDLTNSTFGVAMQVQQDDILSTFTFQFDHIALKVSGYPGRMMLVM
jgi:hypothetical protein